MLLTHRTAHLIFRHRHQAFLRPLSTGPSAVREPGAFSFTGEWASGSGWPEQQGKTVFSEWSPCQQAQVTVTGYAASLQQPDTTAPHSASAALAEQQWRVMRFEAASKTSQQSLAKVSLPQQSGQPLHMLADCLGFEYTKSLAAAVAALVGACPGLQPAVHPGAGLRALLVGLGGGSLALYLAAHFPGLQVDVAELDPVVAKAAVDAMGFPVDRPGMTLRVCNAVDAVLEAEAAGQQYDLVLVDAFDGQDAIPAPFTTAGSPFMRALPQVLHPAHGSVLVNIHGGRLRNPLQRLASALSRDPYAGAGFDPSSEAGAEVVRLSLLYRDTVLGEKGGTDSYGAAYVVKALRQFNVTLVVTRGLQLGADGRTQLSAAAASTARAANILFDARALASNCLWQPSQQL